MAQYLHENPVDITFELSVQEFNFYKSVFAANYISNIYSWFDHSLVYLCFRDQLSPQLSNLSYIYPDLYYCCSFKAILSIPTPVYFSKTPLDLITHQLLIRCAYWCLLCRHIHRLTYIWSRKESYSGFNTACAKCYR